VLEVLLDKPYVGLEIPSKQRKSIPLRTLIEKSKERLLTKKNSYLTIPLGVDSLGEPYWIDLSKMPHLLMAGTTGSGKSVALHSLLLSLLYQTSPKEVRFILIDPKILEFSVYDGIPHLLHPVVTLMEDAIDILNTAVNEMERRYKMMSYFGVRDLDAFNEKINNAIDEKKPLMEPLFDSNESVSSIPLEPFPKMFIFIDEFAELMRMGKKIEKVIIRIAQKARAAGIHLVLATQRPSSEVITGLIKANIPARMAFQVSSKMDSRTILDQSGAEQLLGYGDMLFLPPSSCIPIRVHGAFVHHDEIIKVVDHWKQEYKKSQHSL
jgi:S-DNA-T family DNA segregation ATPase FtsK/SpoIIIE